MMAIVACGGTMSATEYVDGLNSFVADWASDLVASAAAYEEIAEPTMDDWAAYVDREIAIRRGIADDFATLDPPRSITNVHQTLRLALERGLAAAKMLEAVADSATSPAEAERTPEFAEFVAANAEGSSVACSNVQSELDELATTGEGIGDVPWYPDLALTVKAALGCLTPGG